MEFASIFAALGCKVTVVEYFKEILPQFDKDIAKRLRQSMAASGVTFITGACVTAIEPGVVHYKIGEKENVVEAAVVAMAVGRRPNLPEGLELVGVEVERGKIVVDPITMRTSAHGVYAIGDVNGLCMLAHAASAQARIVAGENVATDVVPSVVFTAPEVAIAGMTEQQCKEAGIAYKAVKVPFRGNGKAVTIGETGMNAKNIQFMLENTSLTAFHMSGKKTLESKMQYRNPKVNMGLPSLSEYEIIQTDVEEVRVAKHVMNKFYSV